MMIGWVYVTALVSANDDNWMGIGVGLYADVDDKKIEGMANQKVDLELRKEQKATVRAEGKAYHKEYGFLWWFFKADLSDAEKAAIKARIEKFHNDREALFDAMKAERKADGKIDTEIYFKEFSDLRAKYYADLSIYIDPDKRDEYNAFVAARNAIVVRNMSLREETRTGNKEFTDTDTPKKSDKKIDKDSSFNKIKAKIARLSDTALNALKAYIEVLLAL